MLLLDEITVDLDVLGRADLMRFLVEECDSRGATIIYATHIFDGLEFWPTHVAYVARGEQDGLLTALLSRGHRVCGECCGEFVGFWACTPICILAHKTCLDAALAMLGC